MATMQYKVHKKVFLSDLCGREAPKPKIGFTGCFLSDLCGREESVNNDDMPF